MTDLKILEQKIELERDQALRLADESLNDAVERSLRDCANGLSIALDLLREVMTAA